MTVFDDTYRPKITPKFSYTYDAISFGEDQIATAKQVLADVDFDMIIGTGLSGGLVIPKLAQALDIDWAIVRKEEERSHRERRVEGTFFGRKWLFVDDFVASGETRRRVKAEVQRYCQDYDVTTEYVGTYSYRNDRFTEPEAEGEDEW